MVNILSMQVTLNGEPRLLAENATVADLLSAEDINHETVLVARAGVLLTEDAVLSDGDVVKTIAVVSGG